MEPLARVIAREIFAEWSVKHCGETGWNDLPASAQELYIMIAEAALQRGAALQ